MLKLSSGTFRRLFESGTGLSLHPGTRRFAGIASGMITSHESRKTRPSFSRASTRLTDGGRSPGLRACLTPNMWRCGAARSYCN